MRTKEVSTTSPDEYYQLNSQRIIQIVSDPAFYATCVAFLYMQDMAHARWLQYEHELVRVSTKGCTGCDDNSKALIGPAIAEFIKQVHKLHTTGPTLLQPLREYLWHKLGYRPKAFTLYYRESGKPRKLIF